LNTAISRRDQVIVMIILARWRRSAAAADNSWHTETMSRTLNEQALFSTSDENVSTAN
jgi:hypothetical protein